MIFSSLSFLYVFLPISIILYYLSPNIKIKNFILVVLSLVFYALGEPTAILLLLFCTLANYIFGRIIGAFYSLERSKLVMILAVVFNAGVLVYFKTFDAVLGRPASTIPLGISFFTFQCIAYVIDVYRRRVKPQTSILDFMLFITLFPQLIAGPILRYDEIEPQITSRTHSWTLMSEGICRFMVGLGKKVLIADVAGVMVSNSLGASMSTPVQAWFGILIFGFQIYFDFSGYSDMAIGLGKMFGFLYPENFRYPFTATSISQFWRRWHITLDAFFKDYVYIPLGGNRKRLYFNLFVVWLITGFWHGIGIGYIVWGLYCFVLIAIDKKLNVQLPPMLGRIVTFFLVFFGWPFFYFNSLDGFLHFVGIAFNWNWADISSPLSTTLLINNLPFVILCVVASTPILPWIERHIPDKLKQPLMMAGALGLLLLCTAFIYAQSYVPFLYYKF